MKTVGIIYKFTILAPFKFKNHKPFYVGQHFGLEDFENYWGSGSIWDDFVKGLKTKFPNNWKKLIKREILFQNICFQKTLDKLEEYYIKKEKSHYSYELGGCNILWGSANNFGSGSPSKDSLVRKKISKSRKGKHSGEEHHMFGKKWSDEAKLKNSKSNKGKQSGEKHWNYGRKNSKYVNQRISEANSGNKYWLGKQHSEETKKKLSEHFTGKNWKNESKIKMSKSVSGTKNPMFGKVRINNGIINAVVNRGDAIPEGFELGMLRRK